MKVVKKLCLDLTWSRKLVFAWDHYLHSISPDERNSAITEIQKLTSVELVFCGDYLKHSFIDIIDDLYPKFVSAQKEKKPSANTSAANSGIADSSPPWNRGHLAGGIAGVCVCALLMVLFPPGVAAAFFVYGLYAVGAMIVTGFAAKIGSKIANSLPSSESTALPAATSSHAAIQKKAGQAPLTTDKPISPLSSTTEMHSNSALNQSSTHYGTDKSQKTAVATTAPTQTRSPDRKS